MSSLTQLENWAENLYAENPHGIGANLRTYASAWRTEMETLQQRIAELTAERDKLRAAIEARPHEDCEGSRSCGICLMHPDSIVHDMGHPRADIHHRFVRGNCTCWRSEALEDGQS